jgi:hypothetical protein
MRAMVAEILGALDPRGLARIPRKKLAASLRCAQRTMTLLVKRLERAGILSRPYGHAFTFLPSPELRRVAELASPEDSETLAQAIAAFLDGRLREGGTPREDSSPALPAFVLSHARALSASHPSLRGVDVIQICRLMGEAYAGDTQADPGLAAANWPLHPAWVRHALPAMTRGVLVRAERDRKRSAERRAARAEARASTMTPDYLAARAGALAVAGASRGLS